MSCGVTCQAIIISGILTVIAIIVSLHQTFQHLKNYTNSHFQNKIISKLSSFRGAMTPNSDYPHGSVLRINIIPHSCDFSNL